MKSDSNSCAILALLAALTSSGALASNSVEIALEIPKQQDGQYQRPYVAVWVESGGKAIRTLALWKKEDDWLKDLRRWWRKAGRYSHTDIDAATGATRAPGQYRLRWDGRDRNGDMLPPGDYLIALEAAREHGNRTLYKQKISLNNSPQRYTLPAGKELGQVTVTVGDTQ